MEQQALPAFFHVVARYGYDEPVAQDTAFAQVRHLCTAACTPST